MTDKKENGQTDTMPYADTEGPSDLDETVETSTPTAEAESAPVAASKPKRGGKAAKLDKPAKQSQKRDAGTTKKPRAAGASKTKGNSFERSVGRELSLWITEGERNNIFARNILSGGQFTQSANRGKTGVELNLPGDMAAAHPKAFEFLMHFAVEVKHTNQLLLSVYLLDRQDKSFIAKVVSKTAAQAEAVGLHWMFIGKQDRRPAFVLMGRTPGKELVSIFSITHHWLFGGAVLMVSLKDFLDTVHPGEFMARIRKLSGRPAPAPTVVRRVVTPRIVAHTSVLPRRQLTTR